MKKQKKETMVWEGKTKKSFFKFCEEFGVRKKYQFIILCDVKPNLGFACPNKAELILTEKCIAERKTSDGKDITYNIVDTYKRPANKNLILASHKTNTKKND
jgi:hypothetical protein